MKKNDPILKVHYIFLYISIVIFCFFAFNHSDILITAGASFGYLNGHFNDFYEVNKIAIGVLNYLPSTYILFAFWNIPVFLFGFVKHPTMEVGNVIFWYKTLTSIFFIGSAIYIYKIGILLGLNKKDSKLLTAFWMSSPILIFSQFIFGQYDIFTAFFMIAGFYYYLSGKRNLFIASFAISITFKYFSLLVFVPLLLLIEKRLLKILYAGLLVLLPVLIEIGIYISSEAFREGVFGFYAPRTLGSSAGKVYLVLWLIFSLMMYRKRCTSSKQFLEWALYIPMAVTSLIFCSITWNPQWLLLATPFLALTTFFNKRAKFFIILDIVMMYCFVAYVAHNWIGWVDQSLFGLGVFRDFNPAISDPDSGLIMREFFVPHMRKLYYQLLAVGFLLNVVLKMPISYFEKWNIDISLMKIKEYWNLTYYRFFIGILIFILPAIICLLAPNAGSLIYDFSENPYKVIGKLPATPDLTPHTVIGQVFKGNRTKINKIAIQMTRKDIDMKSHIRARITKLNSNQIIAEKEIPIKDLKNPNSLSVDFEGVKIEPNDMYYFSVESINVIPDQAVSFFHTNYLSSDSNTYAVINGIKQDYNLYIKIYGENEEK